MFIRSLEGGSNIDLRVTHMSAETRCNCAGWLSWRGTCRTGVQTSWYFWGMLWMEDGASAMPSSTRSGSVSGASSGFRRVQSCALPLSAQTAALHRRDCRAGGHPRALDSELRRLRGAGGGGRGRGAARGGEPRHRRGILPLHGGRPSTSHAVGWRRAGRLRASAAGQ